MLRISSMVGAAASKHSSRLFSYMHRINYVICSGKAFILFRVWICISIIGLYILSDFNIYILISRWILFFVRIYNGWLLFGVEVWMLMLIRTRESSPKVSFLPGTLSRMSFLATCSLRTNTSFQELLTFFSEQIHALLLLYNILDYRTYTLYSSLFGFFLR